MSNKVQELVLLRKAGRIAPWEHLPNGLWGKRTSVRTVDGGDDCVVAVTGRAPEIVWLVGSAGDASPGHPIRIFAAGTVTDHENGMQEADAALNRMDHGVPATYIPVDDGEIMQKLRRWDLAVGAILQERVYTVKSKRTNSR